MATRTLNRRAVGDAHDRAGGIDGETADTGASPEPAEKPRVREAAGAAID